MAELPKKAPEVVEVPKVFTKMKNISEQTLQLTCGAVKPNEVVDVNIGELSTLCLVLEGVE